MYYMVTYAGHFEFVRMINALLIMYILYKQYQIDYQNALCLYVYIKDIC